MCWLEKSKAKYESTRQIEMVAGCYAGLPAKCPRTLWNFAFAGADIDPSMYVSCSSYVRQLTYRRSLTLHHNYTVDLTEQVGQWEQANKERLLKAPARSSLAAFFIGINDTGDTKGWNNVSCFDLFLGWGVNPGVFSDHRLDCILEHRARFILQRGGKLSHRFRESTEHI
jgi:hypothetical protein